MADFIADGSSLVLTTQLGECKTELIVDRDVEGDKCLGLRLVNWHTPPDREEAAVELTGDEVAALCRVLTEAAAQPASHAFLVYGYNACSSESVFLFLVDAIEPEGALRIALARYAERSGEQHYIKRQVRENDWECPIVGSKHEGIYVSVALATAPALLSELGIH